MIKLTKLNSHQIEVLYNACEKYHNTLSIFTETLPYEQHKINLSIVEEVGTNLFDKLTKSYKQKTFNIQLKVHQSLVLIKALQQYEREISNQKNKNTAHQLLLEIHPKTI